MDFINLRTSLPDDLKMIIKIILKRKRDYKYNQEKLKSELLELLDMYTEYNGVRYNDNHIQLIELIVYKTVIKSSSRSIRSFKISKSTIKRHLYPKQKIKLLKKP